MTWLPSEAGYLRLETRLSSTFSGSGRVAAGAMFQNHNQPWPSRSASVGRQCLFSSVPGWLRANAGGEGPGRKCADLVVQEKDMAVFPVVFQMADSCHGFGKHLLTACGQCCSFQISTISVELDVVEPESRNPDKSFL